MTEASKRVLTEKALHALKLNDKGDYFTPCKTLYPHQWLWDSCFIAIGLAPHDVQRAKKEMVSILSSQWHNGMIPHMIFRGRSSSDSKRAELEWMSEKHPAAPHGVKTSAITQPPLVAEAVVAIAHNLHQKERAEWLKFSVPKLIAYHSWLYRARDPKEEGVVFLVHPWESGADGSPVWRDFIDSHTYSDFWLKFTKKLGINKFANRFRNDKHLLGQDQRLDTIQAVQHYMMLIKLRRLNYQSVNIHEKYKFKLEDLHFNSILVRANWVLKQLAQEIEIEIPGWLRERFEKSVHALELMYDEEDRAYYSRTWDSHRFIKTKSFYDFMPLYAGTVSASKAKLVVEKLMQNKILGINYLVPTVPPDSKDYRENKYWQGPMWPMVNWFIYQGLKRYGFNEEAKSLADATLNLNGESGFAEYFNAFSGKALGAKNFAPSAGVALSLMQD